MIPLPSKPKIVEEQGSRAVFEIEGLYPGYGQTVGTSLRRVLLSSLKGAAITSVKIEGVGHEFSTIEDVMEDVVEITLNLKQLRFKLHEEGPFTITLSARGECKFTGKDFQTPSQVELITKDAHIATLTSKKARLNIEAVVESGLGYTSVEVRTKDKVEVGIIALDAAFSPVRHVNYEVENMRIGDRTDYNRVRLNIETDGSLTPREALAQAVRILIEQFKAIQLPAKERGDFGAIPEGTSEASGAKAGDPLKIKIGDTSLSTRTASALTDGGIKTVGALTKKKEVKLRDLEDMGDKGIEEIKEMLAGYGLKLKS